MRWLESLVILTIGTGPLFSAEPEPILRPSQPIRITDIEGRLFEFGPVTARRALVFVFLNTECPVANKYLPTLNHLARQYTGQPVELFGVLAEPSLTRAEAARHAAEYRIEFPVLFDASLALADRLKPRWTPEAFVFDGTGRLVYRGRIDDRFVDLGKRANRIRHHELADRLHWLAEGKKLEPAATTVVGCWFEARPGPVTYSRDVAPILWHQCARCHRAGEVAPFALTSYAEAAKRGEFLVEVTRRGYMPPWRAEAGYGHFLNDRRLTRSEIDLIAHWADAGCPEGDPADLPAMPEFSDGWQLGKPDLVLSMTEAFPIPADGPNVFRWFAIPVELPRNRVLSAVEFRPGNRRVVHHAVMFLDGGSSAVHLDAADPAPGYENFGGPGFVPIGYLGSWAPGVTPYSLPEGTGISLPKSAVVALQMHYYTTGKPELDQSRIGLFFAPEARQRKVTAIPIMNTDFELLPGIEDQKVTATFVLPIDVTVLAVVPHMHYLGRRMSVMAHLPTGESVPLIKIADWDFNWQDQYRLAQEVRLPVGTRIEVEATYDNSADNPYNPHSPPKRVTFGQQSTDEMCLVGVIVALDRPTDLLPLGAALSRYVKLENGRLVIGPLE